MKDMFKALPASMPTQIYNNRQSKECNRVSIEKSLKFCGDFLNLHLFETSVYAQNSQNKVDI